MNIFKQLTIAPYQKRGRWYKIFIENDAGTYKITTIDRDLNTTEIAANVLTLPEGFHLVDIVADGTTTTETSGTVSHAYAEGRSTITLPENIDYITVFVYGYKRR